MKKQLTFCLALLTILCNSALAQFPSYLPADGLVGWWPFNGNANDESGNGNHGVVNGAVLTEDRFGLANNAYRFDGIDDIIELPLPMINGTTTSQVTLFARVKITTIESAAIWGKYGFWKEVVFQIGQDGSASLFYAFPNFNYYGVATPPAFLSSGVWYDLIYTLNEQSLSVYVNGALINTSNTNGQIDFSQGGSCSSDPNKIGGRRVGCTDEGYFDGVIDDFGIWNRALTEQEIQNLYTATNTGNTVDTGNGAAPLPQGIPYQAAARDANGQPVVESPVNVRFSLHEGAADGATSYIESHSLTTNSIGLFNTVFGNGTPEQSAFDSINWAATTKFLQVEINLGNGYVDMGTTQLLSVPYAFRSAQAANIKNAALPVYPDNTAALAGGLVAGEMYRTATGDLKIVY